MTVYSAQHAAEPSASPLPSSVEPRSAVAWMSPALSRATTLNPTSVPATSGTVLEARPTRRARSARSRSDRATITYWSGSYNAQVGANSCRQPLVPRGIEGQHAPNRLCQQSELLFAICKTGRLRHHVPVYVSIALLAAQAQ
jgi:hypothetical protein